MMEESGPAVFCAEVRGRLVGSLTLYCGDRGVAEELAQEALVRAWERWSKVSTLESPEAWTFRVGMNLANSWFRRRSAERRARGRLRIPDPPDVDPATVAAVRDAVTALPPRQRATIIARFYLGHSVDETAALLECAPGTVRAATHQAIANLRRAGLVDEEDVEEVAP
jgi:RNA polymerase sigma-70 factor (ECF subfamily)